MKAVSLQQPEDVRVIEVPEPRPGSGELLLQVNIVGFCGTDLNSFRGKNPLITYPRILGHEISATVLQGSEAVPTGTKVTVSPYTHCGHCAACRRGRFNACVRNQMFGVQRDGALSELLVVP